ncbi:hypothetical protein [Streptomyces chartreusis]|uniref:Uncharacterized protein n=1 Tax=Streptomyces chartreusis TaxID=1969 RepID=A0A7H8TIP5_STRCX|nr:hypothetical protein [Streptomyces chartreusis]QKZ23413.1 hypothetical protein HUT05_42275 [Streptomyces chartreusis]
MVVDTEGKVTVGIRLVRAQPLRFGEDRPQDQFGADEVEVVTGTVDEYHSGADMGGFADFSQSKAATTMCRGCGAELRCEPPDHHPACPGRWIRRRDHSAAAEVRVGYLPGHLDQLGIASIENLAKRIPSRRADERVGERLSVGSDSIC